jgi:hypothetical protein
VREAMQQFICKVCGQYTNEGYEKENICLTCICKIISVVDEKKRE